MRILHLLLLLPSLLLAQADPASARALAEKRLHAFPAGTQFAVALVRGGEVQHLGLERTAEGVREVDNRRSLFEIGSISKVFTATLLAQQVERGALRLDQPVQTLSPFPLKVHQRDGAEMTLVHLASHSAGIADHQPPGITRHAFFHGHRDDPYRCFDRAAFAAYLREDLALAFSPGHGYRYTNLGMALLGWILAAKAGKPFELVLQEDLLRPLGMDHTATHATLGKVQPVQGLRGKGEPAPLTPMNALAPCGGVLSTSADLVKFVQAQFDPAAPAFALTHRRVRTLEPGYGVALGWHTVDRKNGERWLNHNGGMEAFTASINVCPKGRYAAIVLCNFRNEDTLGESVRALARELAELAATGHPQ